MSVLCGICFPIYFDSSYVDFFVCVLVIVLDSFSTFLFMQILMVFVSRVASHFYRGFSLKLSHLLGYSHEMEGYNELGSGGAIYKLLNFLRDSNCF